MKSPGSGVANVSEPRHTSHLRGECKKSLARRSLCFCFIFVTDLYYSRSNSTKSPGSDLGNVSELRLTSHLRGKCAKLLARRTVCFCTKRNIAVSIRLLT